MKEAAMKEITLPGIAPARRLTQRLTLASGLWSGFIGGLAGTLCMDAVLICGFLAVGLPAFTCFKVVGDTAGQFFAILNIRLAGGAATGAAAHYIIGPFLGAIFGAAVATVQALRADSLRRCTLLAVLYIQTLAQPLLAATPILLKMKPAETLQWFGISFGMHLIMAVVLGVVVGRAVRAAHRA